MGDGRVLELGVTYLGANEAQEATASPAPIEDTFRRIRNIMAAHPESDWDAEGAEIVLAALATNLRRAQARAGDAATRRPLL